MGAVGLNFGSPTSGTGFDVATTVAAIKANMEAAETPYKTQLTAYQSEDTVISNLATLMSTLSTDVANLTGTTGVLSGLEGSSSDTSVLQLTSAGTGAVAGSHTITVSQLASTSSFYSSPVATADTLSGSLSILVGTASASNQPITVAVDSTNDTISGLAASINAANAGVTASVINGSGGAQLSITSNTSGAAGAVTIDASSLTDSTTSSGVTFSVGQPGQDAEMVVDGIPASSSSNTVSNVLPGVTFQLLNTSTTPVQVQITNNTSSVATAVSTFVTDYNAVVKALNTQEGNDASGNPEPLYGNPLIATIQSQLDSAVAASTGSGSSAIDLSTAGISINNDGTLSLDTDTLNTALNANYSGIVGLFQTAGGMGQSLSTTVANLGNSQTDSLLTLAASQNSTQETDLNSSISTIEANITTKTEALTTALNTANQTLQLIPVQLQTVNELYSAITGYNNNSNG